MTDTPTTASYNVLLASGATITIDNVAEPGGVEKDGSGLRLKGVDGNVLASFDDGQSKACWPASATVTPAPAAGE